MDDAVQCTRKLTRPGLPHPLNTGSDHIVSVNEMADLITTCSRKHIVKRYDPTGPQGVRGRNADITLARRVLGWAPKVSLDDGLSRTYNWIAHEIAEDRQELNITPTTGRGTNRPGA